MEAAKKVFSDSIGNKTSWMLTLGAFVGEFGILTYQRFCSKTIDHETFKRRVASSLASNLAGMVGQSLGAAIGCFIGNLVTPGLGGYLGSLIGGFAGGVSSSVGTDYLMDGSSYTVELYERYEIDDEQKARTYLACCKMIDVRP